MTSSTRALRVLATALIACATATQPVRAAGTATVAAAKEQAIFAVTDNDPQRWNLALNNIANAMEGLGPDAAELELVVYGPGIVMLKKDSPVAERVADAVRHGVRVVACQHSMAGAHLEAADLAPGVGMVPAGVVELIRRQHAGYAYVRS